MLLICVVTNQSKVKLIEIPCTGVATIPQFELHNVPHIGKSPMTLIYYRTEEIYVEFALIYGETEATNSILDLPAVYQHGRAILWIGLTYSSNESNQSSGKLWYTMIRPASEQEVS